MLTNDQAADLVKTLLVKAKKGGRRKKKLGAGAARGWLPWLPLPFSLFSPQSLGSRARSRPIATPRPFPRLGSGYSLSS